MACQHVDSICKLLVVWVRLYIPRVVQANNR